MKKNIVINTQIEPCFIIGEDTYLNFVISFSLYITNNHDLNLGALAPIPEVLLLPFFFLEDLFATNISIMALSYFNSSYSFVHLLSLGEFE